MVCWYSDYILKKRKKIRSRIVCLKLKKRFYCEYVENFNNERKWLVRIVIKIVDKFYRYILFIKFMFLLVRFLEIL